MTVFTDLSASVASLVTDPAGSTSAGDIREAIDHVIDRLRVQNARRYRLEDFGGWGLDTLNVTKVATASSASITIFGSGSARRMRISVIDSAGYRSYYWPSGNSVYVEGFANPENNGHFWVQLANGDGGYVEVINPNAVVESGATVTISGVEVRIEEQNYNFAFDGSGDLVPAGQPFDNHDAMVALLAQARADAEADGGVEPMSILIDFGTKWYPISPAFDVQGLDNLICEAAGGPYGGLYLLNGTISPENPHLFYIDQADGTRSTVTQTYRNMGFVADFSQQTIDIGDRGALGTGDFLHFYQKIGADSTSVATQFPNRVSGVDPQFKVYGCFFSGAPRHGIYMRQRGDCHIHQNVFDRNMVNGIRLQLYDSKVWKNIVAASGESATVYERGSNNVQDLDNHYYFCGDNKGGFLNGADDDTLMRMLATVYVDAPNIKMRGTRIEDTVGPAIYGNKITNLELDVDVNSIGSLGPVGAGRIYTKDGIPTRGGTDWFGADGVPAILLDNQGSTQAVFGKALWRTGRAGQFVNDFLKITPAVGSNLIHSIGLNIIPAANQNAADRARADDPNWSEGPQMFRSYFAMDDSVYHQPIAASFLHVDGLPADDFHARPRLTAWRDPINVHDRLVRIQSPAPTRFPIASITAAGVIAVSGDISLENSPRIGGTVTISGAADAGNNGTFRVTTRSITSDTITIDNPNAVAAGAGGVVVAQGNGTAILPRKPAGTVTRYWAETMEANGDGDVSTVSFRDAADAELFVLDAPGKLVTTEVDGRGIERVVSTETVAW